MSYNLPQRRLVSQADAAMIQNANIPRSKFVGSWTRKTAFDAGYLVPFLVDECLPGDHMRYDITAYVRMSTPLFPLMDNQRIDTFIFFVPARILWTGWKKLMGEQQNPSDSITSEVVPTIESNVGGAAVGSIYDHFGIPVQGQIAAGETIWCSALPLRAYNLIWNEWFRDENVTDSVPVYTGNGADPVNDYTLLRRAKAHDYFTSALPWPQKFTAPSLPLGGLAPIVGLGALAAAPAQAGPVSINETSGATVYNSYLDGFTAGPSIAMRLNGGTGSPDIYADLSAVSGIAINTLRQAWMVQQLQERDARGGTRYTELIRNHFGVTNPDFRLQRPEYIGGGQTPLQITPIAQTAPTTGVPLGALGAAGSGAGSHSASYAATEHGYIIGLINIRTEISYQQGLHRLWTRQTRYDFYWPSLAGLGEQAILRREIYATGNDSNDAEVWGYQERWHEYRTRYSEVTGIMRSTAAGTLDNWHLAQKFTAAPGLNQTFLADDPPMARVLAAGNLATNQQYLCDILYKRTAVRPIPMYGTPSGIGGRF